MFDSFGYRKTRPVLGESLNTLPPDGSKSLMSAMQAASLRRKRYARRYQSIQKGPPGDTEGRLEYGAEGQN